MATSEHRRRAAPRATDADASAGAGSVKLGDVIDGRYRLEALLGKGGMGVVYRAEHVALRRTVAVKLLHPALAAVSDLRSRFEREAIAIGRIDHPNCVSVTDFGKLADGSLFLVMEMLEGRSLGDVLDDEGPLPPERALRILRQVLAGLGHAHAQGIVHRDVKPENVILVRDAEGNETAKMLDFGIAKVIGGEGADEVKLTQAGVAFGTPVYMSPEQAFGNPIDGRADLYAASVLAFEMICGAPPFYADDKLELLSMHTSRPPPAMTPVRTRALADEAEKGRPTVEEVPGVPAAVEELVLRGLAKRPEHRYANAAEYVAAIDAVLAGGAAGAGAGASLEGMHGATAGSGSAGGYGANVGGRGGASGANVAGAGAYGATASGAGGASRGNASGAGVNAGGAGGASATVSGGNAIVAAVPLVSTGEQGIGGDATRRQARPRALLATRRRWLTAAALLVGAIALAVMAATIWRRSGAGAAPPPDPATLAGRAAAQLQRGKAAEAIKTIESAPDQAKGDAEAQLQLGLAYAAARRNDEAVTTYRRVLELDAERGKDARLRASLQAIADDTDLGAATAALELMVTKLELSSARAQVIRDAAAPGLERRRAMAALAEKLGVAHEVDWLASYLYDLDEGEVCAQRKPAVAKLRALGDVRAIPALEASLERKGKVGRWKGKNVNECLVDDVKAALTYLRGLGTAP